MKYFIYVNGARDNIEWQNQRQWAVEELLAMDQELFGASLSVISDKAKRESYLLWHTSMMDNLIINKKPYKWFEDFLHFSSKHLLSIVDVREFVDFDETYIWGNEIGAAVFQEYATFFLNTLKDNLFIDSLMLMKWMQE